MKLLRLIVHQKNFSEEDLIINPKDYPGAHEGDIVEIFHPDDEGPRLLLQIKTFQGDLQGRDTISVEQSIAQAFGLRTYADVYVRLVSPLDVALDSVELTFKDQYMGRSEMWRLKNSLTNTCVYMNKKLEFCGNAVRCQVYEMWSQGDRVACGVITDDTKVVFRSSTSMVYLFLQMSSEMWDFDIHGDLYFEKAVNGFLADLFQKWKKNGSNHEVTIVLFSRTFYEASSLEEFPQYMRECLQQDYRGRYYEDFYRVAVQNERYDDWSAAILVQLRKLFSDYLKRVLEYHSRPGESIPAATNSTAAQGNFLEVLNMSLNVFEKHYLDRSFDRTGQLSVVVTPGVGVFEVDRELTNVTKQRIIDNGVGSDLVCVGEQPLHAVPLLKFHNKDTHLKAPDDYSMPHWINLSFYSTNKKVAYSNFIPRIKLPPLRAANQQKNKDGGAKSKLIPEDECIHNSFFDYDAFDDQVFQLPPVHGTRSLQRNSSRMKKSSITAEEMRDAYIKHSRRKMSDPDIHHNVNEPFASNTPRSQAISIPPAGNAGTMSPIASPHSGNSEAKSRVWTTAEVTDGELSSPYRAVVGSAGSPPPCLGSALLRPGRALINPFDPSHVTIKLTSNRRRWTHIFPKGPSGVLIQQHHYQAVPAQTSEPTSEPTNGLNPTPAIEPLIPVNQLARSISQVALQEYCKKRPSLLHTTSIHSSASHPVSNPSKSLTLLWGATGEQEWTPALTTGVDWKSLTIPACLPITTDYFPDTRALQNDYVVSDYNLLPDDVNADFAQQRAIYKKPLTTAEVFRELVSQRLSQGFQLIVLPPSSEAPQTPGSKAQANVAGSSLVGNRGPDMESTQEYFLSIGRVFHKISLCGSTITVTRYRPRHPYPPFNIHYRYRFHAPHHDTYEVSWVSFTTEKLENYNWNYLDHYICTRGDTDFALVEALKYWRFRVYLLPLNNPATKRIIDGAPHCDIYSSPGASDHTSMVEGYLKFVETIVNKIKRPNAKKPRMSLCVASLPLTQTLAPRRYSMSNVSQNAVIGNSPFRERVGSNRLPDRPRPRSGSKVMERGRVSPAAEASQPMVIEAQNENGHDENEQCLMKDSSTYAEILEAMRHPVTGVGFLTTHPSLPSYTFVSADAVHWLINRLDGVSTIDKAVAVMNAMLREQLICHASGDFSKSFVFGFYLYHMVQFDKDATDYLQPLGDLQSFENEWLEVEVRPPRIPVEEQTLPKSLTVPNTVTDREKSVPLFLRDTINIGYLQGELDNDYPLYKHMHLEIDVSGKSDRIEWGHARYQTVFRPDQAFELVVQWVTASGSIVSELLFGWQRKVQTCGLQMVPIPHDPLALPYSNKSDPLRGPIFIPLDIECLMKKKTYLFEEFREDTWADRLFLFQEAIAARFGFISCVVEPTSTKAANQVMQDHQYIHSTGAMFILIPSLAPRARNRLTSISQRRSGQMNRRYPMHTDVVPSPHEAYITRHVSGKNKDDYDNCRRMGFLWSWNHMISRRWRTTQNLDVFQMRLLRDFKEFCANSDQRLRNYWERCWEMKEDASTLPM